MFALDYEMMLIYSCKFCVCGVGKSGVRLFEMLEIGYEIWDSGRIFFIVFIIITYIFETPKFEFSIKAPFQFEFVTPLKQSLPDFWIR